MAPHNSPKKSRGGSRGGSRATHTRKKGTHTSSVDPARQVALDVIIQTNHKGGYANLVLPQQLRERAITGRDAAFATELTYGALRTQGLADAIIGEVSDRPVHQIDPTVLDILRLGVYQLLRTRVGVHAAVDTSVASCRTVGQGSATGFVNAILRKVAQRSEQQWVAAVAPSTATDPVGFLAMKYCHPRWIAEAFAQALGAQAGELADALAADDARPKVHLAARPGEISAAELALITGGTKGAFSPYAVYLDSGDPGQLEVVRQHLAQVQDEGSQLIARATSNAATVGADCGRWLDLCAGPGGKAVMLGALAAIDGAHVDAVEVSDTRAGLVRTATDGLPVTVHVGDGRHLDLPGGYDRVLVDAPCSGLGALRRRPEARWRKQPSDLAGLTALQAQLLASAVRLTRPGGIVVYSTCSPHLRETRAIVDKAVRTLGVTELDAAELVAPMGNTGTEKSVQMWPHRHGTDAMFLAVLQILPQRT